MVDIDDYIPEDKDGQLLVEFCYEHKDDTIFSFLYIPSLREYYDEELDLQNYVLDYIEDLIYARIELEDFEYQVSGKDPDGCYFAIQLDNIANEPLL